MLSTIAMVRLGKTFGEPDGRRLRDEREAARTRAASRPRGHRRRSASRSTTALAAAGGDAKVAIVSLLGGVDAETARARLAAADGVIRAALEA